MEENLEDRNLVYYCKSCHSLCIITDPDMASEDWDGSYCGDCMSTDIELCTLDEWLTEEDRRRKIALDIEWRK